MNPESTVSIQVVRGLVDIVEHFGVSSCDLLRAAKLAPEQLSSKEARLRRSEVYRLCELAMELTSDSALGLHWSEKLDGNTFVPISHLTVHCPTLRDAFEALSRFQRVLSDHFGYQLSEHGDEVTVRCLTLPGESLQVQRFVAEMIVAGLFRMVRTFNPRAYLQRVSFAYPAPPHFAEYSRVFERVGSVCFDQPFTGIVFDRKLMQGTSPHKDDDLHEALRSLAERRVMRLTQCESYVSRVRDVLLRHGLPHERDMNTVASSLGLSVRSLRRRLSAEGASYNAVVHEALANAAKRLLLNEQRSIHETAYEMGFADRTTFHRAFKRWTGMTPNVYRAEQLDRRHSQ